MNGPKFAEISEATGDPTESPQRELFVIRFSGEVCIKSRKTRIWFLRRLRRNLRDALRSEGIEYCFHNEWSRLRIETSDRKAATVLRRVFGVQSVSRITRRHWKAITDIVRDGEQIFRGLVRGKRFAVRASRTGNIQTIPFLSTDVERQLGSALLGHSAGVDLGQPEVTAHVEIQPGHASYFERKDPGFGGLPIGVEGRALSLISGGFDSAVASWLILKRGVNLDYLFLNLGGAAHQQGVLRVAKVLSDHWSYGSRPRLYSVDFRPVVAQLRSQVRPRYWQLILKRLMLRAAQQVAKLAPYSALVTGDAIGQVSSQTLQNLAVISPASNLSVLRPVVSFNKEEIIALARRIGTYELSAAIDEYCAILPRNPATRASPDVVQAQESQLDLGAIDALSAHYTVFDLRALDPESMGAPHLEADRIDDESVILDLRPNADYHQWHVAGALHLDYGEALQVYRSFDPKLPYLLYCEVGLKSAHLAEAMQERGLRARHFSGGVPALRRWLAANS